MSTIDPLIIQTAHDVSKYLQGIFVLVLVFSVFWFVSFLTSIFIRNKFEE